MAANHFRLTAYTWCTWLPFLTLPKSEFFKNSHQAHTTISNVQCFNRTEKNKAIVSSRAVLLDLLILEILLPLFQIKQGMHIRRAAASQNYTKLDQLNGMTHEQPHFCCHNASSSVVLDVPSSATIPHKYFYSVFYVTVLAFSESNQCCLCSWKYKWLLLSWTGSEHCFWFSCFTVVFPTTWPSDETELPAPHIDQNNYAGWTVWHVLQKYSCIRCSPPEIPAVLAYSWNSKESWLFNWQSSACLFTNTLALQMRCNVPP